METLITILKKTGFKTPENENGQEQLLVHYIKNTDGSIRWAWPLEQKEPLFLKFYNQDSRRGKVFSRIIKLIFRYRLQHLFFNTKCISLVRTENSGICKNDKWTIFTGTIGPNRKGILYKEGAAGNSFSKIAIGKNSENLIKNEINTIQQLENFGISSFNYPNLYESAENVIRISDVSEGGNRSAEINHKHINALQELSEKSMAIKILGNTDIWKTTITQLNELKRSSDPRIPKGMLRKIEKLMGTIDASKSICTTFSHGDFTSWNIFEDEEKLKIYDWELAKTNMPLGYDIFHFIMQEGILVKRYSWKKIEAEIKKVLTPSVMFRLSIKQEQDHSRYLHLYLIINTVYYLHLYSMQEKWHIQISWLINIWNEALNNILVSSQSQRSLVITDVFDFLADKSYATLKFPNNPPESLSEYSDIDLCIDRSHAKAFIKHFGNHNMVKEIKYGSKSFMTDVHLFLEDGSILSIDLIWQLKRKALIMMDAKKLISHSYTNEYGVKMAGLIDNIRFIGLFYAMNHAKIPSRYLSYQEILNNETSEMDRNLYSYFVGGTDAAALNNIVKSQIQNHGIRLMINQLKYIIDSMRGMVSGNGMVITFSGVDGAGKSTIIENLKYSLDKKLRKKVVVIRHRPSLLPILSAWTKGKQMAEKEAATRLPRQGNNYGFLSSLLRFSYYFCDYFFGQFYVYVKYVMRGYVVLYDRYYFDFMNDSRRSNIHLPGIITRTGYKLLLKPDLNFFLYADAGLILSRKKELDSATINQLTGKYLQLFKMLNEKVIQNKYIAIKNEVLSDTVQNIMDKITLKAA